MGINIFAKCKAGLDKFLKDRQFRWYTNALCSLILNLAFATFNLVVGVLFRLVWNFSISFYYFLLVAIKAVILSGENNWSKGEEPCFDVRLKLFKLENVFLFLIDVALIVPIILLILLKSDPVNIGTIPTIAIAAFTTYNIIAACINFNRSAKSGSLTLHGLKIISLKEAIVSVITLQNTMVCVFGNAEDMQALTALTSAGMYVCILAVSVFQFFKIKRVEKRRSGL